MTRQAVDGVVELDALEALRPGERDQLVEEAIDPYLQTDRDWTDELQDLEQSLDRQAHEINEQINEEFNEQLDPHRATFDDLIEEIQADYHELMTAEPASAGMAGGEGTGVGESRFSILASSNAQSNNAGWPQILSNYEYKAVIICIENVSRATKKGISNTG